MQPLPGMPDKSPATLAECQALLAAAGDAKGQRSGIGRSRVNGTGNTAVVHIRSDGSITSWIMSAAYRAGDNNHLKGWYGLPIRPREEKAMPPRQRQPDYHVQNDQIDFEVPGRRTVDARQHIDVYHGTVVHHHHAQIEHQHHGQAHQQRVIAKPTEVRVKRSLWAEVLLGPAQQPQQALPAPQEAYRGEIRSAPAPSGQLALPAPQQAPRQAQAPLQLGYQPEVAINTGGIKQGIAAAFAKVKR